jgi:hypothetical protein
MVDPWRELDWHGGLLEGSHAVWLFQERAVSRRGMGEGKRRGCGCVCGVDCGCGVVGLEGPRV